MNRMHPITVRVGGPLGDVQQFAGRFAWTLLRLIAAGEKGVTPIEHPAPRWSHYVMILRRAGIAIETIEEKHGGPFPGFHGRYVLRSLVEVVERRDAA